MHNHQELIFQSQLRFFADSWEELGLVENYTDDELRIEFQKEIYLSRAVDISGAYHCADRLDDLVLSARYSTDAHVIALCDIAKSEIQQLHQQIEDFRNEQERIKTWSMIRPLSNIHAEIASPFKRSARIIQGRAYQGTDEI